MREQNPGESKDAYEEYCFLEAQRIAPRSATFFDALWSSRARFLSDWDGLTAPRPDEYVRGRVLFRMLSLLIVSVCDASEAVGLDAEKPLADELVGRLDAVLRASRGKIAPPLYNRMYRLRKWLREPEPVVTAPAVRVIPSPEPAQIEAPQPPVERKERLRIAPSPAPKAEALDPNFHPPAGLKPIGRRSRDVSSGKGRRL